MAAQPTSATPGSVPVPPDSVRVWRGFRLESLTPEVFFEKLGTIFVPSTVQLQGPLGLTAYLPTVLPVEKPDTVPEEIAVVFYESQEAYRQAKQTVAGRAYSDLHGLVFSLDRSLSGFPQLLGDSFSRNTPYYLFETPVDWQRGWMSVFVGLLPGDDSGEALARLSEWLRQRQSQAHGGPDGAIVAASESCVVYWEHWPGEAAAEKASGPRLGDLFQPVYEQAATACSVSQGLWDAYPGVEIAGGETFNFQFKRRGETT